jgi:hypothetical protein
MERKKAVIKEIRQKESMAEAGQSTIGDGSKSPFRKFFYSCESFFSIFSSFLSLDASQQCRDRLGVRLSSGHK